MEKNRKLLEVIYNNTKYPLIIEGITKEKLPDGIYLEACVTSENIGVLPSDTGLKYPVWIMEMMIKEKRNNQIKLIISGLDDLDIEEQEKFYGVFKNKGVNGYKFPAKTQIIIPIQKGNLEKISKRLISLSLIYKVED